MTTDKRFHLIGGVAIAALLVCLYLLLGWIGPGLTLALGSTALALGVEVYQRVRREGQPDFLDAAFSAAPGVLLGVGVEVWRHL